MSDDKPEHHRRIRRFMKGLGIPYTNKSAPLGKPVWDGTRLWCGERLAWVIAHDVAHYMIAPMDRKILPEYGLGSDPEHWSDAKRVISHRRAEAEEDMAGDMTAVLRVAIGDYSDIEFTSLENIKEFGKKLSRLEDRGAFSAWNVSQTKPAPAEVIGSLLKEACFALHVRSYARG